MDILSWEKAEVVSPCLPRGLWSHIVIRVFLLLGTVCPRHPPYPVLLLGFSMAPTDQRVFPALLFFTLFSPSHTSHNLAAGQVDRLSGAANCQSLSRGLAGRQRWLASAASGCSSGVATDYRAAGGLISNRRKRWHRLYLVILTNNNRLLLLLLVFCCLAGHWLPSQTSVFSSFLCCFICLAYVAHQL